MQNPSHLLRRKYLTAFGVPILLVLVALSQFGRAAMQDISPWKGGGFGMFSTVDRPSGRTLALYLEFSNQERQFEPLKGDDIRLLRKEALAYIIPTDAYLESFLREFEEITWYCTTDYDEHNLHRDRCMPESYARQIIDEFEPGTPEYDLLQPVKPKAVRAEVWKKTYESGISLIRQEKITEIRFVLDEEGRYESE